MGTCLGLEAAGLLVAGVHFSDEGPCVLSPVPVIVPNRPNAAAKQDALRTVYYVLCVFYLRQTGETKP